MTDYVHLPLKVTSCVDWKQPLEAFLTSTFGRSFVNELSASIDAFNRARADIENAKITDRSLLTKYWKYYANLKSLDMRVPLSSVVAFSKPSDDSIGLQFTWNDVFDSGNETTTRSVAFEKACVLFNMAAVHSYMGATSATHFEWKLSIDYFERASGVLAFIADKFHHCPTSDLGVETVKGLAKLMHAQALEGFLWNYLQSQTSVKHSLVSRLAEGTSQALKQCDEHLSHGEKGKDMNFTAEVGVKGDYFHAFAQVHNAEQYYEADQVGHAIACLKMAKEAVDTCKREIGARSLTDTQLGRLLKELEEEIKQKMVSWDKDNDLIFHQRVPDKAGVPHIKGMEGSKPVAFDTQLQAVDFDDMFSKIVPMDAHEGLSIYSERQADLLREWSENVQVANEQMISTYEFLNIPNSVREVQALIKPTNDEDMEQEADYPRVLAMAHDVEKDPVDFKLELHRISTIRSTILGQVDKAKALFEADRQSVMRGVPPSPDVQRMSDEITRVVKILGDAAQSDSKLKSMYASYDRDIGILEGGTQSVQKWLAESTEGVAQLTQQVNLLDLDVGSSNDKELETAQKLVDSIFDQKRMLDSLIKERNITLNDMKNIMHAEDISTVLLQNKGATQKEMNAIFERELTKYNTYTERLAGLIEKQEMDILELKDSLGKLLGMSLIGRKVEERQKERGTAQAKISSLVRAHDTWKMCTKGIKEAASFYTSLETKSSALVFRLENLVNERSRSVSYPGQTPYQY